MQAENLKEKIREFEAKFLAATKQQLKTVLPEHIPAAHIAAAATKGAADSSSDDSSSDDESEDSEAETARKAKAEAVKKAKAEAEEEEQKKKVREAGILLSVVGCAIVPGTSLVWILVLLSW